MISAFFLSMFLSKEKMIYSFSLLTIIWIAHFFWSSTIISTAILYLIFTPLTFILGYNLKRSNFIVKLFYSTLLILIAFFGFANLWSVTKNFNARKIVDAPEIVLFTNNNIPVRLDTISNKIMVLDLWVTTCGVCFQEFPKYENIYLEYKDNPLVEMYALNIPIKRDTLGYAQAKIEKYNYKFPVIYAKTDSFTKSLNINSYPHLVIIKNGKVRFNGALIMDKDIYFYKLKNEIDLLLKEN